MATPEPKSKQQLLGDMYDVWLNKIGQADLNPGSLMSGLFEAAAQNDFRVSGDILAVLSAFSVDRAEGETLQRLARDESVIPKTSRVSTGAVTVVDSSFTKISTKIYAGAAEPNAGTTTLLVSDASLFTATGAIHIGRGTANVEGPINYSSITPIGSFFQINLDSPTTKFHNLSESVILSQGSNRSIPAGTIVRSPGVGDSVDVDFVVINTAILLDGETDLSDVSVVALQPGTDGNVPRGAIRQFSAEPFPGAIVQNPLPYTTGQDRETDDELRIRIKRARQTRSLGTELAIIDSVIGAVATDENASIVSATIIRTTGGEDIFTTLIIDNGKGYEEISQGVGLENIVNSALGGETDFQLQTGGQQSSLSKAFIESNAESPFSIFSLDRLAILVDEVRSEHIFNEGDFRSEGAATAFEIISSINGNADLLYSARTSEDGSKVVFFAKSESQDTIQIVEPTQGNNAAENMNLPANEVKTIRLFKNNKPLTRGGKKAIIISQDQNLWSNTITTGDTLILAVDDTSEITYTFIDADFIAEGTFTSVAKSNSLASWANVINSKITGITATVNGNQLLLESNIGRNSRAKIVINPTSTLVVKGMFNTALGLSSSGLNSDFTISRNTAQLKLLKALDAKDSLTAGTSRSEAEIVSSSIAGGSITLISQANIWIIVDDRNASFINHSAKNGSVLTIDKPTANKLRFTSSVSGAFDNVQIGDWMITHSPDIDVANRGDWRVDENTGTAVTVRVPTSVGSGEVVNIVIDGIVFTRSLAPLQRIAIAAATYTLSTLTDIVNAQLTSAVMEQQREEFLVLKTKTKDVDKGALMVVTFDQQGTFLGFSENTLNTNTVSHIPFFESLSSNIGVPDFVHDSIAAEVVANPPDTNVSSFTSVLDFSTLIEPNQILNFLDDYTTFKTSDSTDVFVQIDKITGTTIDVENSNLLKSLLLGGRFFSATGFDFGNEDDLVVVLDRDFVNKTFSVPLHRTITSNNTLAFSPTSFNAYDTESGPTADLVSTFGASFDFDNFKILMKARNILDPTGSLNAIIYRSALLGSIGESYTVGYVYPSAPLSSISSTVNTGALVDIRINLKSGAIIAGLSFDQTTEFNITVTNIGATDDVQYVHSGVGAVPGFGSVSPGDIITIRGGIVTGGISVANQGTFRVKSSTPTSITVEREAGLAVGELGKLLSNTANMDVYSLDSTTASEMITFVTDNLSEFLEATLTIEDPAATPNDGSGDITLSTEDDLGFVNGDSVQLVDGLNWIQTSDISGSPQFTFKRALILGATFAYDFTDGEEMQLIPTTADQTSRFLNILGVTGFTSLGSVSTSDRNKRVQISSQVLGSNGAVQVTGGTANGAFANVIGTSSIIDSIFTKTRIDNSAKKGFYGGNWINLTGVNLQKKETGYDINTAVEVQINTPNVGENTIITSSLADNALGFGQPRTHALTRGSVFAVENHNGFVAISHDGVSTDPGFSKTLDLNHTIGDIFDISLDIDDPNIMRITKTAGTAIFQEVEIGDDFTIAGAFDSSNQGTFRIISKNASATELGMRNLNPAVAEVGVVTTGASDISAIGQIREGDTVVLGNPFAIINRGQFRVFKVFNNTIYIKNSVAIEEIVTLSDNFISIGTGTGSQFDITVSNGFMTLTVDVAGNPDADFSTVSLGDDLILGSDFNAANQGDFKIIQSTLTSVTVVNIDAIAEADVVLTASTEVQIHNPAMIFTQYEGSVAGDTIKIESDILGAANEGTFVINRVLDKNRVVTTDSMVVSASTPLTDQFNEFKVVEGSVYESIKKIHTLAVNPTNPKQADIIFEGIEQFNKMNVVGGVNLSVQNRFSYPTTLQSGLDGYRFHNGLVGLANRIVYGEPRDRSTFPGVAAAGAEINIEGPLIRRIQISIAVRVNTGVPFPNIVDQIRSEISALINASKIGAFIAISDILKAASVVPGVTAVSIDIPDFSVEEDVIIINKKEKALIFNPVTDILVSQVGE